MLAHRLNRAIEKTNDLSRGRQGIAGWLLRWGPVVACMAVMYYLSSQSSLPTNQDQLLDLIIKKGGHLTEYAILAVLSLRSFSLSRARWLGLPPVGWGLLTAVCYAAFDEVHQSFTPNRHPMVSDVVIDGCGALLGLLIVFLWSRRYHDVAE
jgi:VanZ family protein